HVAIASAAPGYFRRHTGSEGSIEKQMVAQLDIPSTKLILAPSELPAVISVARASSTVTPQRVALTVGFISYWSSILIFVTE
ncbi:TPA: hypothetical protein ACNVX4_006512, partial [Pseudomonas aeruginosa]